MPTHNTQHNGRHKKDTSFTLNTLLHTHNGLGTPLRRVSKPIVGIYNYVVRSTAASVTRRGVTHRHKRLQTESPHKLQYISNHKNLTTETQRNIHKDINLLPALNISRPGTKATGRGGTHIYTSRLLAKSAKWYSQCLQEVSRRRAQRLPICCYRSSIRVRGALLPDRNRHKTLKIKFTRRDHDDGGDV